MLSNNITSRYAQSLFDLAKERNILRNVLSDVTLLMRVSQENPLLVAIMKNPNINIGHKKNIFKDIFLSKVEGLTMDFISLLIQKRRVIYLESIAKEFIEIYNQFNNIKRAQFIVAKETGDEVKKQVTEILEKKFNCKIELEEQINPSVIGGFRLMIDGKLYDASISYQLELLRKSFSKNLYEKIF